MLALHKQLPQSGTPHEKTALERQIEATDGQIDGGPALWADGGGDRDCGGGKPGNAVDFLADEIYLFQADEEKFR